MTGEEAIKVLSDIDKAWRNFSQEEYIALDMAIKALEQEPCEVSQGLVKNSQGFSQEPCENCISRQAVLDRIRESIETYHNQYTTDMLNMWGLFTQFIKEMPPVKPQESSITWVTGADGAKIAFKDVPVWKAIKICEILAEPQESENKE